MAVTINFDQVSSLVQDKYMPRVRDNWSLSDAFFYRLKEAGRQATWDGGRAMVVPLGFAPEGGGGQWWSGADRLNITARNVITAAIFYRKNYSVNVTVLRDEEDAVRGDTAIARLIDQKMTIAERTANAALGSVLYNDGSDPKAVTGLQYALKDSAFTTQTFGNIARGTSSANLWWNHQIDATSYTAGTNFPGTATGPLSAIGLMWAQIKLASGKKPTLMLSNVGAWSAYHNALTVNERLQRPQQDTALAKAGFDNVMFRTATWVADEKAPRTTGKVEKLYYLYEPAMNLMVHELRNFSFSPFRQAVDQHVKVGFIDWSGELVWDEMRCHGVQPTIDCSAVS